MGEQQGHLRAEEQVSTGVDLDSIVASCYLGLSEDNGGKPGLGGIIMRNTLGRFIVNVVPFCAGYVMGLFRKDRRCLHDIMSGTMVRKRVPAALSEGYGEVFA